MNELESDKIFLKISAHNFEKQKSQSHLKNKKDKTKPQTTISHNYLVIPMMPRTIERAGFCAQDVQENNITIE